MARNRSKRSTTNSAQKQERAQWKHEVEVETLAWLDHNLSKKKSAEAFRSSVADHLKKMYQVNYTLEQIERKLRRLWYRNATDDAFEWTEIYHAGTRCLENLPLAFKEEIRDKVNSLSDQALAQALSSERRLRSASRTNDSELASHISIDSIVVEIPPGRRRHRGVSDSSREKNNSVSKKRKKEAIEHGTGVLAATLPKQEDHGDVSLLQRVDQRIIADSQEGLTDRDDGCSPQNEPLSCVPIGTTSSASSPDRNSPSPVDGQDRQYGNPPMGLEQPQLACEDLRRKLTRSEGRREALLAQLEDEQQKHEDVTQFLQDRIDQLEEECRESKGEVACLRLVCRDRPCTDDTSVINALVDKERQVIELEESLQNRKWLRTFSTWALADPMPLDMNSIKQDMALLGHKINQILSDHEDHGVRATPSFHGQNDLTSLIHRAYSLDLPQPANFVRESLRSSSLSFRAVVCSLVSAAICEWVFECELPDICTKPCALLKTYRRHLAQQDGEVALRNLDFAAHKSLMERDLFQNHIIPQKAVVLADRFTRGLSPLTAWDTQLDKEVHINAFKTLSEEKTQLVEVFDQALRLKAKVVVSKNLFEMVIYPPGTPFDKDVMVAVSMEPHGAQQPFRDVPMTRLCLLPSLHVYEHDRKLVDHKSFIRGKINHRTPLCILNKALVVTVN